jgi:predicted metal-binding membrane protein
MLRQWLQAHGFGPLGLLLWSISLGAWVMIVAGDPFNFPVPILCGGSLDSAITKGAHLLDFSVRTVGWTAIVGEIALMVVAMMAPGLAGPLLHLWYRSLSRHRWRAIVIFTVGYLSTWMIACALLIAAAYLLHALAGSSLIAGLVVVLAGVAWQISPPRTLCLARCHLRPRLSIFGLAALADPLFFGITLAIWCVATCWALMLLPLCISDAHFPLMAAGTLLVASERTGQRMIDPSGLLTRAWTRRLAVRVVWKRWTEARYVSS